MRAPTDEILAVDGPARSTASASKQPESGHSGGCQQSIPRTARVLFMNDAAPVLASEVEDWFDEESDEVEEPSANFSADPAVKYAESQLRVVRETKDCQLDYLQHALQPGREIIDISPAYQRRLRWNNKKKSLLIESFLLNIPVPPIFLFEQDYNEYEVIDGRQTPGCCQLFSLE
jgi:hypothetical protein